MNIEYINKVIRSCNYYDQIDTVQEWIDRLPNRNISDYYTLMEECRDMKKYLKRRYEISGVTSDAPSGSTQYRIDYKTGLFKNATD